jgi:septal ring factor EnvC (AmiA/AmiB activator)
MSHVDDPNRFAEILDDLEAENMSLRLRILDILKWMEEAVTDQVASERRLSEVDAQRCSLQAELDAANQSRVEIEAQRCSLQAELDAANQSRIDIDAQRFSLEAELDAVRQSRADIDVHRRSLEAELRAIHQSRSWRALNPLRKLYARTRAMGARK